MATLRFEFSEDEREILFRDINGNGGFQALLRLLQGKCNREDGSMNLEDEDIGKVVRYLSYGGGGFQGRLADAFKRQIAQHIRM